MGRDGTKKTFLFPKKATAKKSGPKPVFGAKLPSSFEPEEGTVPLYHGVPFVVENAISYLEKNGLDLVGIFRVPGSTSEIQKMKAMYDRGEEPDLYDTDQFKSPHSIAAVLKLYLRELPEPLLTFELYDCFLAANGINVPDPRLECFKKILGFLPHPNLALLSRLVRFLATVATRSDENKMNSANLAMVFAPNLLKSPEESADNVAAFVSETPVASQVMQTMIEKYDVLFEEANAILEKEIEESERRKEESKPSSSGSKGKLKASFFSKAAGGGSPSTVSSNTSDMSAVVSPFGPSTSATTVTANSAHLISSSPSSDHSGGNANGTASTEDSSYLSISRSASGSLIGSHTVDEAILHPSSSHSTTSHQDNHRAGAPSPTFQAEPLPAKTPPKKPAKPPLPALNTAGGDTPPRSPGQRPRNNGSLSPTASPPISPKPSLSSTEHDRAVSSPAKATPPPMSPRPAVEALSQELRRLSQHYAQYSPMPNEDAPSLPTLPPLAPKTTPPLGAVSPVSERVPPPIASRSTSSPNVPRHVPNNANSAASSPPIQRSSPGSARTGGLASSTNIVPSSLSSLSSPTSPSNEGPTPPVGRKPALQGPPLPPRMSVMMNARPQPPPRKGAGTIPRESQYVG